MAESQPTPTGFLLIDKPVGPTSHDIVATVRRMLPRGVKVGHAGTLDPLASGLLILGIGKATKELGKLVGLDKMYEFTVRLGATSETDDAEGPIREHEVTTKPSDDEIKKILTTFIGEQEQIPPMHSAKKVAGVRLYKLARQGKTIERKPHLVSISALDLLRYDFPILKLRTHCTSGTYIRSLARDIGEKLNTGGYVTELRRTAIGNFSVSEAILSNNLSTNLIQTAVKQIT